MRSVSTPPYRSPSESGESPASYRESDSQASNVRVLRAIAEHLGFDTPDYGQRARRVSPYPPALAGARLGAPCPECQLFAANFPADSARRNLAHPDGLFQNIRRLPELRRLDIVLLPAPRH